MASNARDSTLDALAVQLAALQRAHKEQATQIAALRAANARLEGEAAARPTQRPTPRHPDRVRAPLALRGWRAISETPALGPAAKTSRRGMLGAAAKVAAATVAAGVLADQVGTRAVYADNLGVFSSSVFGTPAVNATGTNGAQGVSATSDSGYGVLGASTSNVAVFGNGGTVGVYGNGSTYGVQGNGGLQGVFGKGSTYGVYGSTNSGDGVYGDTIAVGGTGIHGSNLSNSTSGIAVLGHSDNAVGGLGPGIGVQGETASGRGVFGTATTGIGVYAKASGATGYGLYAENASNTAGSVALYANSNDGAGHLGAGIGVRGATAGGTGVMGTAATGTGVTGSSTSGVGVYGTSAGGSATAAISAAGTSGSTGLLADSDTGVGVYALTSGASSPAVYGANLSLAAGSVGVSGASTNGLSYGAGIGLQGQTGSGTGVKGIAGTGVGVYGTTAGGGETQAVYGVGTSGSTGLRATSDSGNGIVALSTSGTGLNVQSASGSAVIATSNGVGYGLYLTAPSGWAIGCNGRIRVLGSAFGTATLAGGATSQTVATAACDVGSLVILTPTSDPGARVWAVPGPGAFTIRASAAPATSVTFTYLLIN